MQRITHIDGAKGLCAIFVFLAHYALSMHHVSPLWQSYLDRHIFQFCTGSTSVEVFIIFSIYLTLLQTETKSTSDIVIKKYFRLAIPVFFSFALLAALRACNLLYNYQMEEGNEWLAPHWIKYHELPFAMLEAPFGAHYKWNNVLWMLRYIFVGTFIAIILKQAFATLKPKKLTFLLLFFAFILFDYDLYAVNIIYAYALYRYTSNHSTPRTDRIIAIVSFIILLGLEATPRIPQLNLFRGMCFTNLVLFAHPVQKFLSLKPFLFLGKISFEIYIYQLPLIYSLSCFLWIHNQNIWINMLITFPAIIVLSYLVQRFIAPLQNKATNNIVKWIKS